MVKYIQIDFQTSLSACVSIVQAETDIQNVFSGDSIEDRAG
jgi:hypothetical protein